MKFQLGILAYGSLIDNPGKEIAKIEADRLDCVTSFSVEFARVSSTRNNAPTLIPVDTGGQRVNAVIICLADDTTTETAKDILYRRERHKTDTSITYTHTDNPGINTVVIKEQKDFMDVQTVLYTSLSCNIEEPLTGALLADYAIQSILAEAGQQEKDGIRYLLSAKRNGIVTALSDEYEKQILMKTQVNSLEEAIEKLDRQRMMYPQQ